MNYSTLQNYTQVFIGKLSKDKKKVVKLVAGKYKDKIEYTSVHDPRDLYFGNEDQAIDWMKRNLVSRANHCFVYKQVIVSVKTDRDSSVIPVKIIPISK